MEGYVQNKSNMWKHAMKRPVGPGERVDLDSLYAQYGVKHNLAPNEEFIEWLKTVKLRDGLIWRICYIPPNEDGIMIEDAIDSDRSVEVEVVNEIEKEVPIDTTKREPKPNEMSVEDIATLSVRKAREVLPKVKDARLLKYSLNEANKLSGKDTLCRLIRKRLGDLEA